MTAVASSGISRCAGVIGRWRRIIVNIDISAGDDCPGEWTKATQSGVSFCRVASDNYYKCSSASFSTNGTSYQRVCGRARGYQKGNTLAFYGSHHYYHKNIDEDYVSGLSITYSDSPWQHIWTFASGHGEKHIYEFNCPCSAKRGYKPIPHVGNNYYCESGPWYSSIVTNYYFNDTLWDGEDVWITAVMAHPTLVLSSVKSDYTRWYWSMNMCTWYISP